MGGQKRVARRRVLVVDIGGTNVKVRLTGQRAPVKIPSGRGLTARVMAARVLEVVADWNFDAVTIGYPGPVRHGRPLRDPINIGPGWVRFDYARAFGRPTRIINDAAMQALGCARGGHMLFLGLGTGLGTAMVVDGVVAPMELAHLPYRRDRSFEDYVGLRGLKRFGRRKWQRYVFDVVARLRDATQADDVVLGGGNAKKLTALPPGTRRVANDRGFFGGLRVWDANWIVN